MRGLAWLGAVALLGCGATEPQEISLGGLSAPAPESLAALAIEVRAAGGTVFVGTVTSEPTLTESAFADTPYEDVRVEFPRSTATVAVEDGLGVSSDSELVVVAPAGPERLVDDAGAPSESYVLSGGDDDRWARASIPDDGTWLFFVRPNDDDAFIVWRAAIDGEVASGEGTLGGDTVSLDDLRLAP